MSDTVEWSRRYERRQLVLDVGRELETTTVLQNKIPASLTHQAMAITVIADNYKTFQHLTKILRFI